ncbi:AT-rich interaction domain 6 [Osmerus eperlanus]|uniref:AT-rich interaction domain 6 n=1 Tax=Osmerus eperlanus TaxID=29151 RepID=UPI002E1360FE
MSFRETEEEMTVDPEEEMREETFLKDLYQFMMKRDSPIERIPHLGFKQIDLFLMYKTVAKMGGYPEVTSQQLWKQVYSTLGGNPRSTSAATCTRRHYEKLILPYECHVKGKDYMEVVPPRPNKRFYYNSQRQSADEECPRVKMKTNHTPLLQTYPMDSTVRVMPVSYHQFYPPGHLTLPSYVPLMPPKVSRSVPQTAPQAPLPSPPPPPPLGPTERVPQPLEHLRYLAERYNRHISQPLDLRRKDSSPVPCNNPASSFTPTSSMKPKFLNRVSPLYQATVLAREEGCERPKTEAGKSSPVYFTDPPISRDGCVIDLTYSRSSRSPGHAPATPAQSGSPIPQLRDGPCDPSMVHPLKPLQTQARPELRTQVKEESAQTSSGPLNLSRSHPSPPRESAGRMEIQIPIALLHDWIKEGLLCGPTASGVGNLSLQTSTGPTSSHTPGPKHGEWAQAWPDIPSSRSDPTNPPFHHPYVAQQMANRSPREKIDRDRSVQSHTATNGDLSPTPAYSPHSYKPIPSQGTWDVRSRDVYRWAEQDARRPYHAKTMQHQTPRDRNPKENPQPLEQDDQGPRSPVSSCSLGTLTPEEFVKLKRLISSS